ncbi:MAG: ATP-binding protein [Bacteroidales bacterium]|nr:ATP-binding protein [Bacteroidales bacterium]
MIKRRLEKTICNHLYYGKIIMLFGARQTGKTTLLENMKCLTEKKTLFLNGDEIDVKELLYQTNALRLKHAFVGYDIVVIDEAQEIPNIGTSLKIISDKLKHIQVIATGSSAFELADKTSEPLTGRKFEFMLFPLNFSEMADYHGFIQENKLLDLRLVFGYYPEVVKSEGNEEKYLKLIAGSYLYKDILRLDNIRRSELLEKILQALALQIGNEVNYNELAQTIGTNSNTVAKYIDVLEKAYIIFKLPALNKNVRNEIKKGKKIYFWDVGIRNAIINNYNPLSLRTDSGALWENFLISERMKIHRYNETNVKCFFWRTTQQQEIDFVEEYTDYYKVFEFKRNKKSKVKLSKTFSNKYNVKSFNVITPSNYEEFIM